MKSKVVAVFLSIGAFFGILGIFTPFCIYSDKLLTLLEEKKISGNLFSPISILWIAATIGLIVFLFIGNRLATFICSVIAGVGILATFLMESLALSDYADFAKKGMGFWFALISGIILFVGGIAYFITSMVEAVEEEE